MRIVRPVPRRDSGYDINLDELTGAQRLELIGVIKSKRAAGDQAPLVTNEELKAILGME